MGITFKLEGSTETLPYESQIYNTLDGNGYYRDTEAGKERRGHLNKELKKVRMLS